MSLIVYIYFKLYSSTPLRYVPLLYSSLLLLVLVWQLLSIECTGKITLWILVTTSKTRAYFCFKSCFHCTLFRQYNFFNCFASCRITFMCRHLFGCYHIICICKGLRVHGHLTGYWVHCIVVAGGICKWAFQWFHSHTGFALTTDLFGCFFVFWIMHAGFRGQNWRRKKSTVRPFIDPIPQPILFFIRKRTSFHEFGTPVRFEL